MYKKYFLYFYEVFTESETGPGVLCRTGNKRKQQQMTMMMRVSDAAHEAGVAADASFASYVSSESVPTIDVTPLVQVRITSYKTSNGEAVSPPQAAMGLDNLPDSMSAHGRKRPATHNKGPAKQVPGAAGAAMPKRSASAIERGEARRHQVQQQQGAPKGRDARAEQAHDVRRLLMGLVVGNSRHAQPELHPGDPWQKLPSTSSGRGETPSASTTPLLDNSQPASPDSFRLMPLKGKQLSITGEREPRFKGPGRTPLSDGDAQLCSPSDCRPSDKKPQYPVLVNFTPVAETGAPDDVRRRARLANKTKISRSLFGGTGDESLLVQAEHRKASWDSTAALEGVKDFAMPSHAELPGRNMSEKEAEVWLNRWVETLSVEEELFTSTINFAEIKFHELLEADNISELRKGLSAPAASADRKPNAFRTAVCFILLDRILPRLGSFAPMIKKLREEIAKSVYSGLNVADMDKSMGVLKSKEPHYALNAEPFFVNNARLLQKIQSMKDRFNDALERMRVAEEEAMQLRNQVASLDARLTGLQMQLQVAAMERSHDQEDFHKRETLLLTEMQQLRDKATQAAVAAAQVRVQQDNGVGGAANSAKVQGDLDRGTEEASIAFANPGVSQFENTRSGLENASTLDVKEAMDFLLKCGKQAMRIMEDDVEQYSRQAQLWQRAVTNTHDISMLMTQPGDTLATLSRTFVPDILLRWVAYHVKQSRRVVVVDGPIKPNNLTVDLADGLMLTQVLHQVLPKGKQSSVEELLDILKSTPEVRFWWCGQKMSELTDDPKWMTTELSSKNSGGRMELLLLLMVTRPSLDGGLFGTGKELQRMMAQVHDRFEAVKDSFAQFNNHLESAVNRGQKLNVVTVELLLRSMGDCKVEIDKVAQHLSVVAEELVAINQAAAEVSSNVAFYLQQRSNQKVTEPHDEAMAMEEEAGRETSAKQDPGKEQRKQSIIAPVKKSKPTVDLLPGKLAQLKNSLTKPVRHIISNLMLEKLQDAFQGLMHAEQVRLLEKAAEACVLNFDLLRRTFRQYCKLFKSINTSLVKSGGAAMSLQSWQMLLTDIHILGPPINCPSSLLKPKKAEEAFKHANFVKNPKNGRYEFGHGAGELEVNEFIEGLLRVAIEWAKNLEKDIVFCFHSIIASIERDAKKDECEEFRLACRSQAVQNLLIQHSDALTYAYKVYSGMDNSVMDSEAEQGELDTSHLESMNLAEFMALTRDAGIQDINLTRPEIVNIFIYVQDDGSVIDQSTNEANGSGGGGGLIGGQPMADDTEMDYGEYCEVSPVIFQTVNVHAHFRCVGVAERRACFPLSDPLFVTVVYTCTSGEQALCGCACYKTLDPYITLPQRLELIIIKHIVPLCNAMKAG
jgi:hypothetical protein